MTCEAAAQSLGPYFDGELDAENAARIAEHLASCAECRDAYARLQALSAAIRKDAPYHHASPDFAWRVIESVRNADEPGNSSSTNWLAIAASVLLAVSLAGNLVLFRRTPLPTVEQALVDDHIRSLIGAHLLDVPSTDQHTVKPWFNGKLDFAPDVRDFAADGFPLVGGRVDYAAGRPVAALVYHRRAHVINVFTWPDSSAHAEQFAKEGYHMLHWTHGGMSYFAVSDVQLADLEHLRDLFLK